MCLWVCIKTLSCNPREGWKLLYKNNLLQCFSLGWRGQYGPVCSDNGTGAETLPALRLFLSLGCCAVWHGDLGPGWSCASSAQPEVRGLSAPFPLPQRGHSVLCLATARAWAQLAGAGGQVGLCAVGKGRKAPRSAVTVLVLLPALPVNPARGRRSCSCAGCNSQVQRGSGASPCSSCCFCDNPSLQPCYLWEAALGLLWWRGSARTTPALEKLFHAGLTAADDMAFWVQLEAAAHCTVVLCWGVLMDFVLEVELSPKSWMLVEAWSHRGVFDFLHSTGPWGDWGMWHQPPEPPGIQHPSFLLLTTVILNPEQFLCFLAIWKILKTGWKWNCFCDFSQCALALPSHLGTDKCEIGSFSEGR